MLIDKERQNILREIMERRHDEIITRWVEQMKLRPEYAVQPDEELVDDITVVLAAKVAYLCDEDKGSLDFCIKQASKKRLADKFPLSAVIASMEGYRTVMTSIIFEEKDITDKEALISDITSATCYCQRELIDEYQSYKRRMVNAKVEELEKTVRLLSGERDRAKKAMDIREHFLNNISHELRSPLTIIQGFAKLLTKGGLSPEETRQMAIKIDNSGEVLFKMISDLILMSKLRGKTVEVGETYIYINDLADKAVHNTKNYVSNDKHDWNCNFTGGDALVVGDFEMLKVMLGHLMENAMKFSPQGTVITVTTHVEESESFIEILDEGIGLDTEDLDMIFDTFRQKDGAINRHYPGSGMGLALARLIAQFHGGDIVAVKRKNGPGSAFTVRLPLFNTPQ